MAAREVDIGVVNHHCVCLEIPEFSENREQTLWLPMRLPTICTFDICTQCVF